MKVDTQPEDAHAHSSASVSELPSHKREAYPNVDYWFVADWTDRESKGTTNLTGGVNSEGATAAKCGFLQTADGELLSAEEFKELGKWARAEFMELELAGNAPDKWLSGSTTQQCLKVYLALIRCFPYLGLCHQGY